VSASGSVQTLDLSPWEYLGGVHYLDFRGCHGISDVSALFLKFWHCPGISDVGVLGCAHLRFDRF
jgi:hypothetical protein